MLFNVHAHFSKIVVAQITFSKISLIIFYSIYYTEYENMTEQPNLDNHTLYLFLRFICMTYGQIYRRY